MKLQYRDFIVFLRAHSVHRKFSKAMVAHGEFGPNWNRELERMYENSPRDVMNYFSRRDTPDGPLFWLMVEREWCRWLDLHGETK